MKTFIKAKTVLPPPHSELEGVNKHSSNTRTRNQTQRASPSWFLDIQNPPTPLPRLTLLPSTPALDFQSSISHHPSISAGGQRGGHKSKVSREPLQDERAWGDGSLGAFGCKTQEGCVYTAPACLSITWGRARETESDSERGSALMTAG